MGKAKSGPSCAQSFNSTLKVLPKKPWSQGLGKRCSALVMLRVTVSKQGDPPYTESFEGDVLSLSVGRTNSNHLVLADRGVSSQHLRIIVDGSGITLEDLGSTNGTFINGERLHGQRQVSSNDEVFVCAYELRFTNESEQPAGSPAPSSFSQPPLNSNPVPSGPPPIHSPEFGGTYSSVSDHPLTNNADTQPNEQENKSSAATPFAASSDPGSNSPRPPTMLPGMANMVDMASASAGQPADEASPIKSTDSAPVDAAKLPPEPPAFDPAPPPAMGTAGVEFGGGLSESGPRPPTMMPPATPVKTEAQSANEAQPDPSPRTTPQPISPAPISPAPVQEISLEASPGTGFNTQPSNTLPALIQDLLGPLGMAALGKNNIDASSISCIELIGQHNIRVSLNDGVTTPITSSHSWTEWEQTLKQSTRQSLSEGSPQLKCLIPQNSDGGNQDDAWELLALHPSISSPGPYIQFRRLNNSASNESTLQTLQDTGLLSLPIADFLQHALRAGLRIMFCEGSRCDRIASRLMNALLQDLDSQRTAVIGRGRWETRLGSRQNANHIFLSPPSEERTNLSVRELIDTAQELANERLVLHRAEASELSSFLDALEQCKSGGMFSIRGNTPNDGINRAAQFMGSGLQKVGSKSAQRQVSECVDLVVSISSTPNTAAGPRITNISELKTSSDTSFSLLPVFVLETQQDQGPPTWSFRDNGSTIAAQFQQKPNASGGAPLSPPPKLDLPPPPPTEI